MIGRAGSNPRLAFSSKHKYRSDGDREKILCEDCAQEQLPWVRGIPRALPFLNFRLVLRGLLKRRRHIYFFNDFIASPIAPSRYLLTLAGDRVW